MLWCGKRQCLLLLLMLLAALAEPAFAEIQITGCQALSQPDTVYLLTNSFTTSQETDCFVVTAPRVTLDCQGNWVNITSLTAISGSGLYSNQDYTAIRNCNFNVTKNYGVVLSENEYGNINGVHSYAGEMNSEYGYDAIWLNLSSNNVIANSTGTVPTHGAGIGLYLSDNNAIENYAARSNIGYAIRAYYSDNNTIRNSVGISEHHGGIHIYEGTRNALVNSTGKSETNGFGINLDGGSRNIINNSTGISKGGSGIELHSADYYTILNTTGISEETGNGWFITSVYRTTMNESKGAANWGDGLNLQNGMDFVISKSIFTTLQNNDGIRIHGSSQRVTISNTSATSNGGNGIALNAHYSTITNSTGTSNSGRGISIGYGSYNNISNSTGTAISNGTGIYLGGVSDNWISNSTGTSNQGSGIVIISNGMRNKITDSTGASNFGDGIIISSSYHNQISDTNGASNSGAGVRLLGGYNNTVSNSQISGKNTALGGALWIDNYAYDNAIENNRINGTNTRAISIGDGANHDNLFVNNTLRSTTTLLAINAQSSDNLFYWNNFTATSGTYVTDSGIGNKYNTTIDGNPEGNIWGNVINGSVAITGSAPSSYGAGWYSGSGGAGYPYNATNSQGKFVCSAAGCADYAPLIATASSPPGVPGTPHISPSPMAMPGTVLACDQNCTPDPPFDPDGDAVSIEYKWFRNGTAYPTDDWTNNSTFNASSPITYGDWLQLGTRACDNRSENERMCSLEGNLSNNVTIGQCSNQAPGQPPTPTALALPGYGAIVVGGANCPPDPLPSDPDNSPLPMCPFIQNIVHMEYRWKRENASGATDIGGWTVDVPPFTCSNNCQPGDLMYLQSRACDQFGACNESNYSAPTGIVPLPIPRIAYANPAGTLFDCIANCSVGGTYGYQWVIGGVPGSSTAGAAASPYDCSGCAPGTEVKMALRPMVNGQVVGTIYSNSLAIPVNHPPSAPIAPHLSPVTRAVIGTPISCDNCPPSPAPADPDAGDTVSLQYKWYANGVETYATPENGNYQYDCAYSPCEVGTRVRLRIRACDNSNACSDSLLSNSVQIVASPPPALPWTIQTAIAFALAISVVILALAYMAGKLFQIAVLDAWVKIELGELVNATVIAVFCIALITSANIASQFLSGESGSSDVTQTAQDFLVKVYQDGRSVYLHLAMFYFDASKAAGFSFTYGTSIGWISASVSEAPAGGLSSLVSQINQGISSVANFMILASAQHSFLQFFKTASVVMLPLGIFLRAFSFTRKTGGLILGAGIATAVIYPASYMVSQEIYGAYSGSMMGHAQNIRVKEQLGDPPAAMLICNPFVAAIASSPIPLTGDLGWKLTICPYTCAATAAGGPGAYAACIKTCSKVVETTYELVTTLFPIVMGGYMHATFVNKIGTSESLISNFYEPLREHALPAVAQYSILSLVVFLIPLIITITLLRNLTITFGGDPQLYGMSKLI